MNLPGVGQNLHDHLDFILAWKTHDKDIFGIGPAGGELLPARPGVAARRDRHAGLAFAEGAGFLRPRPASTSPTRRCISSSASSTTTPASCIGAMAYPPCLRASSHSTGEVFLESADPLAAPGIDPCYLSTAATSKP